MGFKNSASDHSLFIYYHGQEKAYILLYVDDIILTTSTDSLRDWLMAQLSHEFAMKDLVSLSFFLGIAISKTTSGLHLSQQKYASEILERAGMSNCKPVATPVDTSGKLSANDGPLIDDPTSYRSLAGALQYLTSTRPDLTYVVQQICMYMHAPRASHLHALKQILRYVQGTISFGLTIHKSPVTSLIAYTDADWAGCLDTRRSTSGYCIFLENNLLSWSLSDKTLYPNLVPRQSTVVWQMLWQHCVRFEICFWSLITHILAPLLFIVITLAQFI